MNTETAQTMAQNKPWDDPKIQMMLQILKATVTAVTPLNIMEVRANGKNDE